MLIILFGLSGAGKNFVGNILTEQHPYFYCWDADDALTLEMRLAIKSKESFTQQMRDKFTSVVIDNILMLQKKHSHIVVTQALYKEQNRTQLARYLPDAHFVWVQATGENIIDRLQKREIGVTASYAKSISPLFEKPDLPHAVIINDTDEKAVINQLEKLLKSIEEQSELKKVNIQKPKK